MSDSSFSVVICCFNSAARLPNTMRSLANQDFDKEWEIIVVDNNSTDNTVEIVNLEWNQYKLPNVTLRVVNQPKAGLNYAREKGVSSANFDFIVFCDDDNWLDKAYLNNLYRLFKTYPQAAIIGGAGIAEFEHPDTKPFWFDSLYHGYAVGEQSKNEGFVNGVYGAGMAIRNSLSKSVIYKTDMLLSDRKEHSLLAGGDGEICLRVRLAGYQILYSPSLTFKHFIPANRLTWDYLKKLYIGFANCHLVIDLYETALKKRYSKLPTLYWLKKGLYFTAVCVKYWPKHYRLYKDGKGSVSEIQHLTWKFIALSYFNQNFRTIGIYNRIMNLLVP